MSSFEERRRRRANWPIRSFRLGQEPVVDERDETTVDDRLALVWRLTLESWAVAGLPIPTYSRANMPGKILREKR